MIPKYPLQFFSYVTDKTDEAQIQIIFERAYEQSPLEALRVMFHKAKNGHKKPFCIAMDHLPSDLSHALIVHHINVSPEDVLYLTRYNPEKFADITASLFARQILFNMYYLSHGFAPDHELFKNMSLNMLCEKSTPSENGVDSRKWNAVSLIIKYINGFNDITKVLTYVNRNNNPKFSDIVSTDKSKENLKKISFNERMTSGFYRKWCSFIRSVVGSSKKNEKDDEDISCKGLFTTIVTWNTPGWAKELAIKINDSRGSPTYTFSECMRKHGKKRNVNIIVLTASNPDLEKISFNYEKTLCNIIFMNLHDKENYFSRLSFTKYLELPASKYGRMEESSIQVVRSCSEYFRNQFCNMLAYSITPWDLYKIEMLDMNMGKYFEIYNKLDTKSNGVLVI